MLILSTYRVVLHPSCLQKVFSFIIFIKERCSFTILSKKSRAPGGGAPWTELKSDEYLSAIISKTHTFDVVSFTVCSSESWPGYFIAGTAPSFSNKQCANPASNWALFVKRSSTNTLEKLCCCPGKTNFIHSLCDAGFFGKLNKVIFPSQPKTHFFWDILPEWVPCSAAGWSALMAALLLLLRSMGARAHSSGRNAHIRSSTIIYVSKSHARKKTLRNLYVPESEIFGTEILCYTSK